jgi:inosose dehydratase
VVGGNAVTLHVKVAAMSLNWNNPTGNQFAPWLDEVKEAGYDGITGFASSSLEPYIVRPQELKRLLDERGLRLASVDVHYHTSLDYYKKVCEFMAVNECENLAYIDPKGGAKEFEELGRWMNAIGELSLGYGIKTMYHNHTRGIGETYAELERVHASVDPQKVFVMLDLGHATKDFSDLPVRERAITFLRKYWGRIRFMEFKDWNEATDLNTPLGEGHCDYGAVFALMREQGYEGWVLVEQNGNEGWSLGRTPLACSKLSRAFIRRGLGV